MKKYFFAIKEAQFGPFSLDEILTKDLDKNTLVWFEGLPEWVRLSEIPELNIKRDPSLPPPIRVKGNRFRNKNSLKIFSAIAFIVVILITSGLFLYPKWENEKKYEEALSVYMKTDSIQFEVFNELAIKNHTKSNFILGIYYYELGDSIKVKESLEEAISNGYEVPGLYLLYWTNPKDSSKYEERIEENFVSWVNDISDSDWLAQVYAGKIYEFGIGVKRNPRKAIEFYEMASKNGSVQADFLLGVLYSNVEEVKDYEKSLSFLKKADELGYYPAAGQIGKLYEAQKNYDQSIYWFTKGAKTNEIFSEYRLGYFYSKGLGVSENLDSAKYWYERALENKKPQKASTQFIEEIKGFSKEFLDQVIIFDKEEKRTANNQIFNCLLNDAVDRHSEHSFSENEFTIPFKRGDQWVFYKDYKWSDIHSQTGEVLDSGTWKCDGDDEFEIDTQTHTFSSKRGWIKK